jgi:hypothetical protein
MVTLALAIACDQGISFGKQGYLLPITLWFLPEHRSCFSGSGWPSHGAKEELKVNVAIWLPATFALGLLGIGLCFAFISACENI